MEQFSLAHSLSNWKFFFSIILSSIWLLKHQYTNLLLGNEKN